MGIILSPELEKRIAAKVKSGRYQSVDDVIEEGLELLEARDAEKQISEGSDAATISATIIRLGEGIPEEEWSRVPTDFSKNIEHYLYGSPRESE